MRLRQMRIMILVCCLMGCMCAPALADLSRGSRGEDVKHLQSMLIDLGFLHDKADGIFGRKTQAAVRDIQRYWGIEETGVADEGVVYDLESLWRMAMGVEIEYGAPVSDEDYPPCCRFTEDSYWFAEFCAAHIDQYPIAIQLSVANPPEELERMLAGRICGMWYVDICAMYMEWAEELGENDRHIAMEQMAGFEAELARQRAVWNEQSAEGSADALVSEINWLERMGVDLCFSLHGDAPGRE